MRSRWLIGSLLFTTPLHAQTSVETGGGMARLDNFSSGAFSSFRGRINQQYGAIQFAFANTTTDHRSLGTAYRTDIDIRTAFALGSWQINVGPQGHLARGIETPTTRTLGANLGVVRDFGGVHLAGDLQRGLSWFGQRRIVWDNAEVALRTRMGIFQLGSTLSTMSIRDSVPRNDVSFDLRDPRRDTLYRERTRHFQDAGISVGWQMGRLTVGGEYGGRFGTDRSAQSWWKGDLAVRVASSLAITLNTSQLPADQLLHLYGGRYASLGLRLGGLSTNSTSRPARIGDPFAVEIARVGGHAVALRFAIPGARETAIISGEFSDWQPVSLTRLDDGRWEAVISARPGLYRVNIRVDGGSWTVPPGLRSVADDFGGTVGLLVIR